jgi:hypothetical protein
MALIGKQLIAYQSRKSAVLAASKLWLARELMWLVKPKRFSNQWAPRRVIPSEFTR